MQKKFYKILLLDAARKYFSPAQIKEYIDVMAEAGFHQLQLYLSDIQGFRFALDDMTVKTNSGKTYDLRSCLGPAYAQPDKKMYPHDCKNVISQSEMNDIIEYANEKGVEIVPCLNSPGHMGAILEGFPEFRYTDGDKTSKSSIDLNNPDAVEFALAYVGKYIKYFKKKGLRFFNIGADEYANDVEGMGFEGLIRAGIYDKFVAYINKAAQMVIDAGMTPRIFNDCAYYASNVEAEYQMNDKIQVYYWDCYDRVADVKTVIKQGHEVINANKNLYYVVAVDPWICVTEEVAEKFDRNDFVDKVHIDNPLGIMMSIWCDDGRDETMTAEEIMRNTLPVIRKLSR